PLGVAAGGAEADEPGRQAERLPPGAAEATFAARVHEERHDALADLPPLDALAQFGDAADDLDPGHERKLDGEARDSFADVDVEVVQGGRGDVDHHLAGTGL